MELLASRYLKFDDVCFKGDHDLVMEYLEAGFDIHKPRYGHYPLHSACRNIKGDTYASLIVIRLIRAGANVNVRHLKTKTTPLMLALAKNYMQTAWILYVCGADIDARDIHERPIEFYADFGGEKALEFCEKVRKD